MQAAKFAMWGIIWMAWTIMCFGLAVQASNGYSDGWGMLLGVIFSGFAFIPAAVIFHKWYLLQNPKRNR